MNEDAWKNRAVLLTIVFVPILLGCLILAGPNIDPVHAPYQPPGGNHFLGTDNSGRDVKNMLVRSAGVSMGVGLGAGIGATIFGALVGSAAGYLRSRTDDILMRVTDVFLLIPTLPLVIVLAAYLGPGVSHATIVIGLTLWPGIARLIRSRVLSLRERGFVISARCMGGSSPYVMIRHILPNCSELLLAEASLSAARAMVTEAGLSFLGLGDPVSPSWGSMLRDAFSSAALLNGYWWWYLPPMVCIAVSVVLFNLAGDFLAGRISSGSAGWTSIDAGTASPADITPQSTGKPAKDNPPLLSVDSLSIRFADRAGNPRTVVDGLCLSIQAGQKITVIGATGSGKSLLLLAIAGLLPEGARKKGRIWIAGRDLERFNAMELRRHRGKTAAYVPQGVGRALNPVYPIGRQVAERMWVHWGISRRRAINRAREQLETLGLPDSKYRMQAYPQHLSGGMKQRVILAMALMGNPLLLLADEPTKGIDPRSLEDIYRLFQHIPVQGLLTVTHDLDFAEAIGGNVMVMYAGVVVETAPAGLFFQQPLHPYSKALVLSRPSHGMRLEEGFLETDGGDLVRMGCPYRCRCPQELPICVYRPELYDKGGRLVRCWRHAA